MDIHAGAVNIFYRRTSFFANIPQIFSACETRVGKLQRYAYPPNVLGKDTKIKMPTGKNISFREFSTKSGAGDYEEIPHPRILRRSVDAYVIFCKILLKILLTKGDILAILHVFNSASKGYLKGEVPEWSNGLDWKSSVLQKGTGGSNPPLSAIKV